MFRMVMAVALAWAGDPFVDLRKVDFSIAVRLEPAALAVSPPGGKLIKGPPCYLRKQVAEALARVQASLRLQGLGLVIKHCWTPPGGTSAELFARGGAVKVVPSLREGELAGRQKKKDRARFVDALSKESFTATQFDVFLFRGGDSYPIEPTVSVSD